MSLIRDTYIRFQVLVHEVAKFGIVGAIGFVVQLGVQNALYPHATGALTALVIGYTVATLVTFVGNRASRGGAVLALTTRGTTFRGCRFLGNEADNGAWSTVGLQGDPNGLFTKYSYYQPSLRPNSAIEWTFTPAVSASAWGLAKSCPSSCSPMS